MAIPKELTQKQKFNIKNAILRMKVQGLKPDAIKREVLKKYNVELFDDTKVGDKIKSNG